MNRERKRESARSRASRSPWIPAHSGLFVVCERLKRLSPPARVRPLLGCRLFLAPSASTERQLTESRPATELQRLGKGVLEFQTAVTKCCCLKSSHLWTPVSNNPEPLTHLSSNSANRGQEVVVQITHHHGCIIRPGNQTANMAALQFFFPSGHSGFCSQKRMCPKKLFFFCKTADKKPLS